jgi:Arc/MetJ-type ribon-helix-helix transcriptional regulator
MTIALSPESQKLVESQLREGNFSSAEKAVQFALEAMDQVRGDDIEELDGETQAAIERAFAQSARGEGRPWEEVRRELTIKYLSK